MSKLMQIESLENGSGIQYLLDAAYRIFLNPMCIHNNSFDLIAYTDVVSDDPIWVELIGTGTISLKTQDFYVEEGFIEGVANADKMVYLKSSKLQYDRIVANVVNSKNILIGVIVIVACNVPFDAEDAIAFEKFSEKISKEFGYDDFYNAYGSEYQGFLINKLLDGDIKDFKTKIAQIQILYAGFEEYLYLAVVDIAQNDIKQTKSLLESKFPSYKFAVYCGYIVMIMSSKYKNFNDERFFEKYYSFLEQNNLFIGVSDCFENIYKLRNYYDQAVEELKNGIKANNGQRVFSYQSKDLD